MNEQLRHVSLFLVYKTDPPIEFALPCSLWNILNCIVQTTVSKLRWCQPLDLYRYSTTNKRIKYYETE